MNKKIEKTVAKAVVEVAEKSAKLPNQACWILFGKPKAEIDLAVSDYERLESFIKQKY